MPRPRDSERQDIRSQTRQALLDAAAQEFAQYGFEAANVNRISLAAGFAKGTIYNYFPSKRALMHVLISETVTAHVEYMQAQVRQVEAPDARLRRFFAAGFEFVPSNLDRMRVMITLVYGPDMDFKERLFAFYQPMFAFVAQEILVPGIQQGIFRAVDPQETAVLLMSVYLGTGSQVSEQGQQWLEAGQVADLALIGLGKHVHPLPGEVTG